MLLLSLSRSRKSESAMKTENAPALSLARRYGSTLQSPPTNAVAICLFRSILLTMNIEAFLILRLNGLGMAILLSTRATFTHAHMN